VSHYLGPNLLLLVDPLLGSGHERRTRGNEFMCNNRGTVGNGVSYAVRAEM
jgi:hypothetical protein